MDLVRAEVGEDVEDYFNKDYIYYEVKRLGDTIAKITEATGIKSVVKFIAGDDCGCDERQEYLNRCFLW